MNRDNGRSGRGPDFIIGGAMKSGTSTLHHILRHHPNIYLPPGEIHFFTMDDFDQSPDFFPECSDRWVVHDFEEQLEQFLPWYRAHFQDAAPDQVTGEDSTVYLCSRKAPRRIHRFLPEVKLVFLLRNPVERTYSHYWHLVKTGRAVYDFEDTLKFEPQNILQRSYYELHLKRYLNHFDREQIKVLIFEDFVERMEERVNEILSFLGVDSSLDLRDLDTHRHPTSYPRFLRLQLLSNAVLRSYHSRRSYHGFPGMPDPERNVILEGIRKGLHGFNFSSSNRKPPMRERTREFLQNLLAKENRGLSELVGKDVSRYWGYFPGRST